MSFNEIKDAVTTARVLVNPDFSKEFIIACDASKTGVGGVLEQTDENGNERVICYFSQKLNAAQKNYSITELECYAAVLSIKFFRPYVEGHKFRVITDHSSLRWLMDQKDLTGRLARWSMKLSQFKFTIEHRKGSLHTVPDALSRCFFESIEISKNFIPIDLNSEEFKSTEYLGLIDIAQENGNCLPDLKVKDGLVYKRIKFYRGNVEDEVNSWRLWLPSALTKTVIENQHAPPSSSHGGYPKTLFKVRQYFYWPGMAKDINRFVQS